MGRSDDVVSVIGTNRETEESDVLGDGGAGGEEQLTLVTRPEHFFVTRFTLEVLVVAALTALAYFLRCVCQSALSLFFLSPRRRRLKLNNLFHHTNDNINIDSIRTSSSSMFRSTRALRSPPTSRTDRLLITSSPISYSSASFSQLQSAR